MSPLAPSLHASEAARRLGISVKALRLYEQHGLVRPHRTAAGWRLYGPEALRRAGEVAALRALGLSLAQVAQALEGHLASVLAAHQAALESESRRLRTTIAAIHGLRAGLAAEGAPAAEAAWRRQSRMPKLDVSFDLPWPWGGERFALREVRRLTYITGPLGSGKTRLARRLAEVVPGARFLGLERLAEGGGEAKARLHADPALKARVTQTLARLADGGGRPSDALVALLAGLEAEGPALLVVDMIEDGLDEPTQKAVIAHLRHGGGGVRPLVILTRSRAILDLDAAGPDEAIILCPANHSPPIEVAPCAGTPGYEAVAMCLASPAVRARTADVIAWRPRAA